MNDKAYTIIELLAVIAIIGLLFTIGVVSYSYLINRANDRVYESYLDSMHEAAQIYVIDNPLKNGESTKIMLSNFVSDKAIEPINNPKSKNDKCLDSYIDISRYDVNGVVSYKYKTCLICANEHNNCGWSIINEEFVKSNNCTSRPSNPMEGDTYSECEGDMLFTYELRTTCLTTGTNSHSYTTTITPNQHNEYYNNFQDANSACFSKRMCEAPDVYSTSSCNMQQVYKAKTYEYSCRNYNSCKTFIN